ncbi:hypothetical protein C0J52_18691 [Blattella germanica]|nr:hypothetical protein C0J52_18691 [Blattella germanica]
MEVSWRFEHLENTQEKNKLWRCLAEDSPILEIKEFEWNEDEKFECPSERKRHDAYTTLNIAVQISDAYSMLYWTRSGLGSYGTRARCQGNDRSTVSQHQVTWVLYRTINMFLDLRRTWNMPSILCKLDLRNLTTGFCKSRISNAVPPKFPSCEGICCPVYGAFLVVNAVPLTAAMILIVTVLLRYRSHWGSKDRWYLKKYNTEHRQYTWKGFEIGLCGGDSQVRKLGPNTQGHGGPPWISDQLNARATSETTRTYRQRHHSHPHSYQQGEYDEDDHDGQMMSGDHTSSSQTVFPGIKLVSSSIRKNAVSLLFWGRKIKTFEARTLRKHKIARSTHLNITYELVFHKLRSRLNKHDPGI